MGKMKNYKQFLKELPSRTVVFAFGRFNPPTTGHELLIKAVKKVAADHKAEYVIYASKTEDAKKNPLPIDKKVHYLNLMFPGTNFKAANPQERTFIEAAKFLNKKYKNLIMVAGSDRIAQFEKFLNDQNGKEYHFDTIQVVSAGERDPDADDATGMSGTKMRALAAKGNYKEFKKGLPSSVRDLDGKRLMNDIRVGMKLDVVKEQIKFDVDEIREKYFRGEIFNVDDIVESEEKTYKILKRGSNHLLLQCEDGNKVNKWIQDVTPSSREFMLNEDLTTKTLKPTDKIKVARMIATIVGIENAESSSNPEQLVNNALRKLKTKALNADSLKIVNKMLALADEVEIKYDAALKPQKLKEEAEQIDELNTSTLKSYSAKAAKSNLTNLMKSGEAAKKTAIKRFSGLMKAGEKIAKKEMSEGVADTIANYTAAKSKLQHKNLVNTTKAMGVKDPAVDDTEASDQASQNAQDAANFMQTHTAVGHSMHNMAQGDQHRRRKVKYHLGEASVVYPESGRVAGSEEEEQVDRKKKVKAPAVKDDSYQLGSNNAKGFDAFFEDCDCEEMNRNAVDMSNYEPDQDEDMSEEDIDKMIEEIDDFDDVADAYEDDEFSIVDDETGEEIEDEENVNEEVLAEVLSRIERIKAKARFARTKAKRERAVKIALKRYSGTAKINQRARKLAISLMKKRLLRGRNPSDISVGEKERVERMLNKRKAIIGRVAMKLAPRVRQIEKARMSHTKFTKPAPAIGV